jgi:hypothetical protein
MKMTVLEDASGARHVLPLVVSPWPTYTGKWWPAGVVGPMAAELGFPVPSRELPHGEVLSRLVVDVRPGADGAPPSYAVDGVAMPLEDAVAEIRRSASAHPGRAMIARTPSGTEEAAAREAFRQGGVERVVYRLLRRAEARAEGPAAKGDGL